MSLRRSARALIVVVAVGCHPASEARTARRSPRPDLPSTTSAQDPTFDTDPSTPSTADTGSTATLDPVVEGEIVAAAELFATEIAHLSFTPVQQAIDQVTLLQEAGCPQLTKTDQGPGWVNQDCRTSHDVRFYGVLISIELGWEGYTETELGEGVLDRWGPVVDPGWTAPETLPLPIAVGYRAIFTVERDEDVFAMSDIYQEIEVLDWSGIRVHQLALGAAIIDPEPDPGSWVARGLVPNVVRTTLDASGGGLVLVDGSLDGLDVSYDTVWASALAMGNTATDPCPMEPEGSLAVRDPTGAWFDLRFDGDTGGVCDGCAEVRLADEVVGTACPDLSALLEDGDR